MADFFLKASEAEDLEYITSTSTTYQPPYKQFTTKVKGEVFVNITQLERRKKFVERIKYLSGCNYYILIEHLTEAQIARFLFKYLGGTYRGWYTFINAGGLFAPLLEDKSLRAAIVPMRLWNFYRATRCLIRCILRRWGKGSWEYGQLIKELYK